MIRCVRMWTGEDGDSLFEEGWIDLAEGMRGDSVGEPVPVVKLSFQETVQVLEKCFEKELAGGWRDRLKTIIPTYGIDLTQDAAACRDIRAQTAAVLKLANV
jgi:Malate:quinone oxidoreductase (Mqo)